MLILALIAIVGLSHWYYNYGIRWPLALWFPFLVFTQSCSAEAIMTVVMLTNFVKMGQGPVPEWLSDYALPATICVNIIQAVVADTSILNGVAGLLLGLHILNTRTNFVRRLPDGRLIFPSLTNKWSSAFTLWSVTFIYGYASDVCGKIPQPITGIYLLVALALLIVPWTEQKRNPGSFVDAFIYTLALFLPFAEFICLSESPPSELLPSIQPYDPSIHLMLAISSILRSSDL